MSEVIETYIRRHPGLSEREAFEGFLQEDRIKAWVGTDESRKERLRSEFGRVWGSMSASGKLAAASARAGPSGPAMQSPRTLRVEVQGAQPVPTRALPASGGRKLQVMCTSCGRIDVWMHGDVIGCRACGHVYDDMLQLIRVTPVGPFEFLFGEGWQGYATAGGLAAGFALLYFLLRGL